MAAIDSRLGESDAWDDPDAANALTRERTLLQREQDDLEEHWLEASTARDAERTAFEQENAEAHEPMV